MDVIHFYKTGDAFGEFSNFSSHPIIIDGLLWRTVEHYYQSCKFNDDAIKEKIRKIDSPMQAALVGRDRNNIIKKDWDNLKDGYMYKGLKAKFLQNPQLRYQLLDTGNALIVEHTVNDSYWGDGGNGKGLNKLGKFIMQIREELKVISDDKHLILPPWLAFPEISPLDMFWRMGRGEDYISDWWKYYQKIDKKEYQVKFFSPPEWDDFYTI